MIGGGGNCRQAFGFRPTACRRQGVLNRRMCDPAYGPNPLRTWSAIPVAGNGAALSESYRKRRLAEVTNPRRSGEVIGAVDLNGIPKPELITVIGLGLLLDLQDLQCGVEALHVA